MREAFANTLEKDLWNGKKPKELEQTGGGVVVVGEECVLSQAPLSMGFSKQEYWSVLLFPSPGDLS